MVWTKQKMFKNVSTPSLTSIRKVILLHGLLLMSNSVHSMMKTSMLFPLAQEENLMECVTFCFVFHNFFELVVLLCAPIQHDECCFFPSNNWTVRTNGCVSGAWLSFTEVLPYQGSRNRPYHSCKPSFVNRGNEVMITLLQVKDEADVQRHLDGPFPLQEKRA